MLLLQREANVVKQFEISFQVVRDVDSNPGFSNEVRQEASASTNSIADIWRGEADDHLVGDFVPGVDGVESLHGKRA